MDELWKAAQGWLTGIGFNLLIVGLFYLILSKKIKHIKTKFIDLDCTDNNNLLSQIYDDSLSSQEDIDKIIYKARLYEQMRYCDDMIEDLRIRILNNFFLILKNKGVTDIFSSPIYISYENIISIMLSRMCKTCRINFKEMLSKFDNEKNENDEYEFVRADFNEWKKRIVSSQIGEASSIITKRWVENDIIKREEAYEKSKLFLSEISESINDVYYNAIIVQLKYSKDLKKLTKMLTEYKEKFKKGE